MTVSTPLPVRPVAPTPHVTRHTATSDVSYSHVAPRSVPPCASSAPPPTLPTSHSNVGISNTATSSRSHVASHVSHSHVASPSVQAQSTPSSSYTRHPFHSSTRILSTNLPLARPIAPMDISHPPVASCPTQANSLFVSSSMPPISHSMIYIHSTHSPPPLRKRSRRCFVCGGTGKHRLNPRFCPRTYELLSKRLVKFDANFRLVSDDGSPLPMTRHPGGVAAHLLSPRRPPRTSQNSPPSVSKSPCSSDLNPPHVPHAPHDPPKCVPHRVPHAVPNADLNPSCAPCPPEPRSDPDAVPIAGLNRSHTPPATIVHLRHIPSPEPTFELNPPHFPPIERLPSPPLYLPVPIHDSRPTPSNSTPRLDNAFILQIFDCFPYPYHGVVRWLSSSTRSIV